MRELINKTIAWADERMLLNPEFADRQVMKMVTEVGEFVDEVVKGNKGNQRMELGDVMVTLVLTAKLLGLDLEDSLQAAYDKISQRKGRLVNGVFVKEGDNATA